MQIDYYIGRATSDDLDEIALSELEIFKENAWHRVSIEAELYKSYSDIFIARGLNNALLGYSITWCINNEEKQVKECEVITLAVCEKYRKNGIASALLNNVINLYGTFSTWHLEVAEDNLPAISLYKKFGFSEQGRIKNYYGDDKDALRMTKL